MQRKFVWGRSSLQVGMLVLGAALLALPAAAQSLRVSWDANTDPFTAGYRLFGGTQPGNYTWTVDVGNATTAPLPPFAPGSSYYFVVRAYNAVGAMGPASNEASVDLGPPGMPTGVSATSAGSRVTLSWGAPGDGAAVGQYLVSVGTGPGAANIVSDAGVGNQLSASGDLGPGRYFARVRAANSFAAGPFSSEIAFVVGGPDAPGNPTGLVVSWQGTVATFRWNQGVGAANYILEAGSTPGGSNLGAFNMGGATQYSVDVPVGTYYVRVRAANPGGVSGPSNELVVRGPGAPARPGTLTATNTAAAVTLRWSVPSSGAPASGYVLEAGSGPGLANLAVVQLGNQTTYVAAAPPPGTYYVRVRAINARGAGDASNEVIVRR